MREIIPLLVMGLSLILIPDGSRLIILLKLTSAGIIYILTLYLTQFNRRPQTQEQLNPLMNLIQLVIGV